MYTDSSWKRKRNCNRYDHILIQTGDTKTTANDKKITCTVTVNDFTGNTATQLKDKSGRLLYKDSECKKPATVADYNANGTYYTEPVYTGWQTIDGKVITIPATISV